MSTQATVTATVTVDQLVSEIGNLHIQLLALRLENERLKAQLATLAPKELGSDDSKPAAGG